MKAGRGKEEEEPADRLDQSSESGERSESVGDYVYEDEAERSLAAAIESSCVICNRQFGENSVRVVIPRYMLEHDYYYRNGYVSKRFMCRRCYDVTKSGMRRETNRTAQKAGTKPRLASSVMR